MTFHLIPTVLCDQPGCDETQAVTSAVARPYGWEHEIPARDFCPHHPMVTVTPAIQVSDR